MPQPVFDKSFFHGGDNLYGTYADYSYENFGTEAERFADLFVERFRPKSVLDVGCAKGFMVEALVKRGVDTWGTDISDFAVRDSNVSQRLKVAALGRERLPFDESFDVVACMGVLDYIPEIEAALEELKRLARKHIVILAGVESTGVRIARSRADLDRVVETAYAGMTRDHATENALASLRNAVICDDLLRRPRTWKSRAARWLPRKLAYALYARRLKQPAFYVLNLPH